MTYRVFFIPPKDPTTVPHTHTPGWHTGRRAHTVERTKGARGSFATEDMQSRQPALNVRRQQQASQRLSSGMYDRGCGLLARRTMCGNRSNDWLVCLLTINLASRAFVVVVDDAVFAVR